MITKYVILRYVSSTILAIVLGFPILVSIRSASAGFELALEAELATKIQPAMKVATTDEAKAMGGPEPDEPSNGKFIWAPGAPVTGGGDNGFAEYIINLPKAGKYAIWGRVIAWDGNSDSFWVTWQPADPDENPQQTQNTKYRWAVAQGPLWHWDRINHWLNGGTFDRLWEFDKGETKLTVYVREDATMLDCLFITDSLAADEGSAGVRLPTDEDRNFQLKGKAKAVNAEKKLLTLWSNIKTKY
ncbi:MAG: hypothetical protein ACUVWN_01135 [bacterium]